MDDGGSPFEGGRFHYVKLGGQHDDEAGTEPQSVPPPGGSGPAAKRRRGRAGDRVIGILIGLILGVGIVTAYVFLGSEETIDAPRIQHEQGQTENTAPAPDRDGEAAKP